MEGELAGRFADSTSWAVRYGPNTIDALLPTSMHMPPDAGFCHATAARPL